MKSLKNIFNNFKKVEKESKENSYNMDEYKCTTSIYEAVEAISNGDESVCLVANSNVKGNDQEKVETFKGILYDRYMKDAEKKENVVLSKDCFDKTIENLKVMQTQLVGMYVPIEEGFFAPRELEEKCTQKDQTVGEIVMENLFQVDKLETELDDEYCI